MIDEPFLSRLKWARRTVPGGRPENEDRVIVVPATDESALLAVVADGLGGQAGGEIAAETAVGVFAKLMERRLPTSRADVYDLLLSGFDESDRSIRARSEADASLRGMGATLASVFLREGQLLLLYAGDCRVHHFRRGSLLYVTRDHNVAEVLAEAGEIPPEEVCWHPNRSVVTSSLGDPRGRLTVAPAWNYDGVEQPAFRDLQAGDVVLLCSDGLTSATVPAMLEYIVRGGGLDVELIAERCLQVALAMNVADNVSLVVIAVRGKDDGPPRPLPPAKPAEQGTQVELEKPKPESAPETVDAGGLLDPTNPPIEPDAAGHGPSLSRDEG
jgi:protein phosphatase